MTDDSTPRTRHTPSEMTDRYKHGRAVGALGVSLWVIAAATAVVLASVLGLGQLPAWVGAVFVAVVSIVASVIAEAQT